MKNKMCNAALAAFCALAVPAAFSAQIPDDLRAEAQEALANFLKADSSLQTFLDQSAGYAIFPTVAKGGLVVGAAHGKGLVYEAGNLIGLASMTQASIGAQAGGQTFSELIVFEAPAALNEFKAGTFEMRAEVSAVAAAEGASKTARYRHGVAVFTMPKKGLMVQASVGGQKFKFEPLQ